VAQLLERHKPKAVAVVLANKNTRIIWAIIATRDALREEELAAA
jgi:transposase